MQVEWPSQVCTHRPSHCISNRSSEVVTRCPSWKVGMDCANCFASLTNSGLDRGFKQQFWDANQVYEMGSNHSSARVYIESKPRQGKAAANLLDQGLQPMIDKICRAMS